MVSSEPPQLFVTFFRPATNPQGEPYGSPIHSYCFDADTPREQALEEARRMFIEDYGQEALAQVADTYELSTDQVDG